VAAAAKAAALALRGEMPESVDIPLPDATRLRVPCRAVDIGPGFATAKVRKDAGDDPDVTDGLEIFVLLEPDELPGIRFAAGAGVGIVTLPGLQVPVGEPAINPSPRRQVIQALAEVGVRDALVTVMVPGGEDVATRTFNPRLGVVGGISILGTSGRVRPFSHAAVEETVRSLVSVGLAAGLTDFVLTPGHVGSRGARRLWPGLPSQALIEVSNAWGVAVDALRAGGARRLVAVGHPGKLAKLAAGDWDTHSGKSPAAVDWVYQQGIAAGHDVLPSNTVEGLFASFSAVAKPIFGQFLSRRIVTALEARSGFPCAVVLVGMDGGVLGQWGDLSWA
jgi:cobalt-precorrin-5B (C1)-methyltransferase